MDPEYSHKKVQVCTFDNGFDIIFINMLNVGFDPKIKLGD